MSMTNRAQSFSKNADIYREVRPPYPKAVYDEIQHHAQLDEYSNVLEIGAGHGVATLQMAQSWKAHIFSLEPGVEFYRLLTRTFRDYPRVAICHCAFEEYQTDSHYDCICAATSFHWIDPTVRYAKSAQLLKTGGILAVFWNNFSRNDTQIFDDIQEIYVRYHPDVDEAFDVLEWQRQKIARRKQEVELAPEFVLVSHKEYAFTRVYTADEYVKLLHTFPANALKNGGELDMFYTKIRDLFVEHGDYLELPIQVNLEIGRKISA